MNFVTTLIILLSVTNIALGYGLAIYLGHVRAADQREINDSDLASEGTSPVLSSESTDDAAVESVTAPTEEVAPVQEDLVAEDETSPEQEVLDSVETIQKEIPEQPEPSASDEASAAEEESSPPEAAIPESPTPESPTPEPSAERETAASEPVTEEELMQGIGEFQNQLKTQQERSKLHAVTDTPEE